MSLRWYTRSTVGLLVGALAVLATPTVSAAPAPDRFYTYDGSAPLSDISPGSVLKTRSLPYHLVNVPTPLQATQILYRSTDAMGRPSAAVTSVLRAPNATPDKVISYQSAYDSMNPEDGPSRAIAGDTPFLSWTKSGRNLAFGGGLASAEFALFAPLVALGYTIVMPDTEGPQANFAAGPEYGMTTLDSIRAVRGVPETGVTQDSKIGLLGYSGGAIASNWAAILAPSYAPDVNDDLVGVAQGGLLVHPAHNLNYASGSIGWAGIVAMAVVGIARAYEVDFDDYLNDYGREISARVEDASIGNVFLQYPGVTWAQLVKPEYADPNSVPEFVDVVNKINMGLAPIPETPMFIAQAANGILEGTRPGPPGVGDGDGIMVAGDVRALANRYCDAGLSVQYDQYDTISHVPGAMLWWPGALAWLHDRMEGKAAPSNCGRIAPGNSLEPAQHAPR